MTLVVGYTGKNNFGDNLFETYFPEIFGECVFISDEINCTEELINKADKIVIGGGSLIYPDNWVFSKLINYFNKFIFFNVNVTNIINENVEFLSLLKSINAKWWVRDNYSLQLLEKNGFDVEYLPDIIFSNLYKPIVNSPINEKILIVCLNSNLLNDLYSNNINTYLTCIKNIRLISGFINWMGDFGWLTSFISMQISDKLNDNIFNDLIKIGINPQYIYEGKIGIEDVIKIKNPMMLSTRYHASALAIKLGIPLIDIFHDPKTIHLLSTVGVNDCGASYNSLSHEKLVQCAQYAESELYKMNCRIYVNDSLTKWNEFLTK